MKQQMANVLSFASHVADRVWYIRKTSAILSRVPTSAQIESARFHFPPQKRKAKGEDRNEVPRICPHPSDNCCCFCFLFF